MKMKTYGSFCIAFASHLPLKKRKKNNETKNNLLEQAHIPLEYNDYYDIQVISTLIIALLTTLIFSLIFLLIPSLFPFIIYPICTILIVVSTWNVFLYYPLMTINSRKRNIDRFLPFAVNYINTMAKTNISPLEIFYSLSTSSSYGLIKDEAQVIVKEIQLMGIDNIAALKNAIERSPSKKFKGFLQGFIGTIQAGSSLQGFLSNMAEFYMNEDMRDREKNLESLSLIAELFVTAVIAFPIFLVIIVIVFSFTGSSAGSPFGIIYLLSFIVLPLSYFGFYYLIKTTLNDDYKIDPKEKGILHKKSFYKKHKSILAIIGISITFITIFITSMYFAFTYEIIEYHNYYLHDIIFISLLMFIGPYSIFCYKQSKKGKEIQERFPDFLIDMGNSLSSGMTVYDSIDIASKGNYGKLTKEIKKMKIDLSWHIPIKNIFSSLAIRLKNNFIDRIILTINKGLYMGGGDASIFKALSNEIKQINQIDEQRNTHMSMYLMIIIMCFGVFLFIMIILNNTLFSYFFEFQETQAGSLDGFIVSIDKTRLHYSLYSFTFVQAIGAGLLGGFMKDGAIAPGLRYSFALGLISMFIFQVLL